VVLGLRKQNVDVVAHGIDFDEGRIQIFEHAGDVGVKFAAFLVAEERAAFVLNTRCTTMLARDWDMWVTPLQGLGDLRGRTTLSHCGPSALSNSEGDLGRGGFGDGLQVCDAAANGKLQLPRKNQRGKWLAGLLAAHRFDNQVFIPRKEDAIERRGAVQEIGIFESSSWAVSMSALATDPF